MKRFLIALIAILPTSFALAGVHGGENEGTSMCSFAKYECQGQNLAVCVFDTFTYVSSGGTSNHFPSQQVLSSAGLTFSGEKSTLKIQTELPPSADGWQSHITVQSLGLDAGLYCKVPIN